MVSARLLAQVLFAGGALAGHIFERQQSGGSCTSDDACKKPCSAPAIRAQGVKVTPSQEVQAEARRRFGDAHCENGKCACALTSDDQAQDFCKYWIEHDQASFKGATYLNGGIDADKGVLYCVFVTKD